MMNDDDYYDKKTYIGVSVMAASDRRGLGNALISNRLSDPDTCDFTSVRLIEDNHRGEWQCGMEAWLQHTDPLKSDWTLVIQDDAIIGDHLYDSLQYLLAHAPNAPISLYTGSVRPKEKEVRHAIELASRNNINFLVYDDLLWGVAVLMPTWMVKNVIGTVKADEYSNLLYDRRLGAYFKERDIPVFYTWPSLVDHNFTLPSETGHDEGVRARRAIRFDPGRVTEWDWNKAVKVGDTIDETEVITCADY